MSDVALPIFTIISILLIVLPTASHWRAKNVIVLVLIMWLAVGNLNTFINRAIWMNRSSNVAPVWCDISVKLMSMVTMGIPCAMFCIAQKLEAIASMRDVSRDASKSTQKKLYEAAICCALPLAYSILTILSQGHRFNIIEGQGCSPAIYLSPVSIVIDYGMPLFMSVLSLIYSVAALKHFIMHKHEFELVLERSGSTLSTKKFLRMISFTLIDLLINFPILITEFSMELLYKDVEAYTSWGLVHRNFSRVSEYPAYALNNPKGRKFLTVAELSAWMVCASGIVFFLLFGFSVDARIDYMKAKQSISTMFSQRFSAKRKSANQLERIETNLIVQENKETKFLRSWNASISDINRARFLRLYDFLNITNKSIAMDAVQEVFTAQTTSFLPLNSAAASNITAPVNKEIDDGTGPNGVYYCVIA